VLLVVAIAVAVAASAVLGHQLGSASARPPATAKQLVIENPYDIAGSWYKGNLHVASVRGLGRDLPSAIGKWYAAHGFSFLAITDMNTFTWTSEYGSRQLTAVPAVEASYPFGDLLAVGMDHWLPAVSLQAGINWIAEGDGLPVLAAPRSATKRIAPETLIKLKRLFAIEIYVARLAAAGDGDGTALWDALLSGGNRVYGFAGDDATSLADAATGQGWVGASASGASLDALLSSLRHGSFYASSGPEFSKLTLAGRTIEVEASPGTKLRFIGRGGHLLKTIDGPVGAYQVSGNEGYVRVEATRDAGGRAWSQPFFVTWR
jgi:hypothetical protein